MKSITDTEEIPEFTEVERAIQRTKYQSLQK